MFPGSQRTQSARRPLSSVENVIIGSLSSLVMERNGKYCVCGHPACKKSVKAGGHRLSCFTGDHLKAVVKTLLPLPCHEKTRESVIAKPYYYMVHTSHFLDCDKVPGQGGHQKLKTNATPIPFGVLFSSSNMNRSGTENRGNVFTKAVAQTSRVPFTPLQSNVLHRVSGLRRPSTSTEGAVQKRARTQSPWNVATASPLPTVPLFRPLAPAPRNSAQRPAVALFTSPPTAPRNGAEVEGSRECR